LRIHAFELFADPEAVAGRIAGLIGVPEPVPMEATGPIELPRLSLVETPESYDPDVDGDPEPDNVA
jgi:hypothetical protein